MITNKIDLTLQKLFATDHTKEIAVVEHKRFDDYSNDYKTSRKRVLVDGYSRDTDNMFLTLGKLRRNDSYDDILCESVKNTERTNEFYVSFYLNVFGKPPPRMLTHNLRDPWAEYMFCSGDNCDCCGVELHLLNTEKYRTLCTYCDINEDREQLTL